MFFVRYGLYRYIYMYILYKNFSFTAEPTPVISRRSKWVTSRPAIIKSTFYDARCTYPLVLAVSTSFTLYPAHNWVGGNLALRYSVLQFSPNSGGFACWEAELNAGRRNENINSNKYFTSSSRDRTHNQLRLQ